MKLLGLEQLNKQPEALQRYCEFDFSGGLPYGKLRVKKQKPVDGAHRGRYKPGPWAIRRQFSVLNRKQCRVLVWCINQAPAPLCSPAFRWFVKERIRISINTYKNFYICAGDFNGKTQPLHAANHANTCYL